MTTPTPTTRREFIGKTAGAASALTVAQSAWAAGSDQIKVGLIGCGGRGSGAANQALSTKQEGIVLHAVADAFKEKADGALSRSSGSRSAGTREARSTKYQRPESSF